MIEFFTNAYKDVSTFALVLEAIAFVFGIASVYFAKHQNILVYPTGLIATAITVYLLYVAGFFGDMIMNFYYSVMSVYGWYKWSQKTPAGTELPISRTNSRQKIMGVGMFVLTIFVILGVYKFFGDEIKTENYIDIFTSGIFFTAMWFMALKKIENWTLWIIGDIISIPLYAHRGLGMLSLQFLIFTILAVQAYLAWRKILKQSRINQYA
ncbi:MAG: nicotinamide mononucleotide transporter [Flavobacterium sp.]|nr:nicotinamide mononucleotide transporter [Flavobacterium sp.]